MWGHPAAERGLAGVTHCAVTGAVSGWRVWFGCGRTGGNHAYLTMLDEASYVLHSECAYAKGITALEERGRPEVPGGVNPVARVVQRGWSV